MTRGEKMQQESMVKDIMGGMSFYICKKAAFPGIFDDGGKDDVSDDYSK